MSSIIFFKRMYLLIHYIKTQQKTLIFQWYVQDSKLGERDWEKQRNDEKRTKTDQQKKEKK